MGVGFVLVNHTKREVVTYGHLSASKARELAGNPATAAITTWYLLQHREDHVAFVSDSFEDWPFTSGSRADLGAYTDATDRTINELVEAGILRDDGIAWTDDSEPALYGRALTNIWMEPQ